MPKSISEKKQIRLKVSPKGALSIYGINTRFPVTLYKNQWLTIFEHQDLIMQFLDENDSELSSKDNIKESEHEEPKQKTQVKVESNHYDSQYYDIQD